MSITAETAKAHAHDPAVLCCRAEAGITIEPANLEDPAIFDDLVDSGLLSLDGCLTIEEVLGAKLTKTCDSLCPLTADVLDGVKAPSAPAEEEEEAAPEAPAAPAPVAPAAPAAGGVLKIHIGEGKDIDLEIPVGALGAGGAAAVPVPAGAEVAAGAAAPAAEAGEEKVVRSLTRKHFNITEVKRGPEKLSTIRNWLKISTWRSSLLTNITPILRPSWTFSRSLQKKATLTLVQV